MFRDYIRTPTSHLSAVNIDINDLLGMCVKDIEGKLTYHPPIVIYGKQCIQHRNIGFFSDESIGYTYSNQLTPAIPLTDTLRELINHVNYTFNADFNGILVNHYESGEDYIGKHSDNEMYLSNVGVVCISYGAQRTFRIRDKLTGKIVANIPTTSGEMWIMGGNFQKEFTHEIPVEKKIKDSRISFTFRKHLI
jgi:alkylated DNA repair dioxygenase AlkB